MTRVRALLWKEFVDLRLNPWVLLPSAIAGVMAILLPVTIAVIVPAVSGESLTESGEFAAALGTIEHELAQRGLDAEAMIQALLFSQFLMFLILMPVLSATGQAAHSVVSEKQARTLEPLLATPITALELLLAKTLAAFLPALAMTTVFYILDVAAVAFVAKPGVVWVLLSPRSLVIVFLLGPLAVFAALQLAVCISSRVEDERNAQALGAVVVLPVLVLFVTPLLGVQLLTPATIAGLAVAFGILNIVLMRISIRVFDRESILTRWK